MSTQAHHITAKMDSPKKFIILGHIMEKILNVIRKREEAEAEFYKADAEFQKEKENVSRYLATYPGLIPYFGSIYQKMIPNGPMGHEGAQSQHMAPGAIQSPVVQNGSLNQEVASENMSGVDQTNLQQYLETWVPEANMSMDPRIGLPDQTGSMIQDDVREKDNGNSQSNSDLPSGETCITSVPRVPVCYSCYVELCESSNYLVDPELVSESRKSCAVTNKEVRSDPITITLTDSKKSKTTYTFTFIEKEDSSSKSYFFQVAETTIDKTGSVESQENRKELSKHQYLSIRGKLSDPKRRHLRRNARYYASFIADPNPSSSSAATP